MKGKFTVVRAQGTGKWSQDWGNSGQIRLGKQADTKSSNVQSTFRTLGFILRAKEGQRSDLCREVM